jgi:hypothetical protein
MLMCGQLGSFSLCQLQENVFFPSFCLFVCALVIYSAPSGSLLRGAPEYRADTASEFHAEALSNCE